MHTIGLLLGNAVDRRLLAAFLHESGYAVRAEPPGAFKSEAWAGVSLMIVDEASARYHQAAVMRLKRRTEPLFVPLLIMLPQERDSTPWLKAGCDDVLRVPITKGELTTRLQVLLRRRDATEAGYRATFENTLIGLYRSMPNGRLVMANPAFVRLLGFASLDECAQRTLEELGFATDPPRWAFLRRVGIDGSVIGQESTWVRPDGQLIHVRESARSVTDPTGAHYLEGTIEDITARKQAEEAVIASERRFRALIEQSSDAIALLAADGTIEYASPSTRRVLGYGPEELLTRKAADLIHPEDRAYAASQMAFVTQVHASTVTIEFRAQHRDGTWRWLEATGTNLLLDPTVEAVVANYRDITERKLAEQAQAHLAAIVESSQDSIVSQALDGTIISWNKGAERLFAYAADEIIGQSFARLVPPDRLAETSAILRQVCAGTPIAPFETARLRQDGRLVDVSLTLSPIRDRADRIVAVSSIARDITERKQTEEALRQSELRFRVAAECASDFIYEYDAARGTIRWFGPLGERLGYEAADFPLTLEAWVGTIAAQDRERVVADWAMCLAARQTFHGEYWIVRHDGAQRCWIDRARPLLDEQGQVEKWIGAVTDVTERRQAEAQVTEKSEELRAMTQQLWQAAKLATVGEVAASIAHELNNPLATISLRVEQILADLPADSANGRALAVIETEVERMARLVQGVLDFGRRQQPQVSTVDLCTEIDLALELVQHHLLKSNVNVIRECAPAVSWVQADRQHLRQVFLNLLTNACDAMPEGGDLTIRVNSGQLESGLQAVVLEFSDTGVGIPPEHMPHLWDTFFTTKPAGKGSGLGLPICRRIVHEHGGTIEVYSQVNQGTTIRITLPVQWRQTEQL